jgi:hypothetical protein
MDLALTDVYRRRGFAGLNASLAIQVAVFAERISLFLRLTQTLNPRLKASDIVKSPHRLVLAAFLGMLLGLHALPSSATVTIPLTMTRMVEVSDLVVDGTVVRFTERSGTVAQGSECPAVQLTYTDIILYVHQVYRGRISVRRLLVRVLGGRVEAERILRDTYLPFRLGERVMLFLQMNGEDDFPFVGFHQGILRFRASGPNRTMPDLDQADTCVQCVSMVVDGRDHLLMGFNEQAYLNTLPASRHPVYRVIVGPGEDVPVEPTVPVGGVFPQGFPLPPTIATPGSVRLQVRTALQALGLNPSPPPLGDPNAPLANQLRPGDPIVRCGLPALLSDEPEAFEEVPGGDIDDPIEPGPSE